MSDVDFAALRALVDAATPGPWASGPAAHAESQIELRFDEVGTLELIAGYGWDADAKFIAAVREAVPALLDLRDAVLALHHEVWFHPKLGPESNDGVQTFCDECVTPWPCATARACGVTE